MKCPECGLEKKTKVTGINMCAACVCEDFRKLGEKLGEVKAIRKIKRWSRNNHDLGGDISLLDILDYLTKLEKQAKGKR